MWLAGLLADVALTYALGRGGDWRIRSAVHWTERYGLIVILALGESIIALGLGASQLPMDTAILVGALLGVGPNADADTIRAAHRRLIARVHPDAGGSAELARRTNAARDLLLQELGRKRND